MSEKESQKRFRSHRLTPEELQAHQLDQTFGTVKTTQGNKDENYEMPANEDHLVHARIWTPQFNPTTGQDESVKIIQKFYPQEFESTKVTNGFAGAKVEILHSPDAKFTGQEPGDESKPKIVSVGSAAGLPLDESLSDKSFESLKSIYKLTYGVDAPDNVTAEQIEAKIKEKVNYLNSDARVKALQISEQNRLATAGQPVTATQEAKAAGTGAASEGGKVDNADEDSSKAGSTTTAQRAAAAEGTKPALKAPAAPKTGG